MASTTLQGNRKLEGKDLITIGIYTVIYLVTIKHLWRPWFYSYLYSACRCFLPVDWWHRIYVVCDEGQEIWHVHDYGPFNRNRHVAGGHGILDCALRLTGGRCCRFDPQRWRRQERQKMHAGMRNVQHVDLWKFDAVLYRMGSLYDHPWRTVWRGIFADTWRPLEGV